MSKRAAIDEQRGIPKRFKPEQASVVEQIHNAKSLQQLLVFQQDAVPRVQTSIKTFKTFLESIAYAEDRTTASREQAILREFLEAQGKDTSDGPYMHDFMQTWSFAAQTNNDALLSSVCATLALLLRTISTNLELREYGMRLGRTIMEETQLKILARCLSAPRPKEHIISPALRLLTEIVTFDGGVLAHQLYAVKSFTLDPKILSRNISFWKPAQESEEEEQWKPAIRTVAIRYLLANLKFQSSASKVQLLRHSNVFRALFEHVRHDPFKVLQDLLSSFKANVLLDRNIPRQSKSFVLHEGNLKNIAGLYRSHASSNSEAEESRRDQCAHEFLKFACTSEEAGILRPSSWYPPGTERVNEEVHKLNARSSIDLGLDSVEWFDKFHSRVPVRNIVLVKLALSLKPHASMLESELLLDMFRAAPELVAYYFTERSSFGFDPKLTATWIGYSTFIYSAVQLPIPSRLGLLESKGRIPPPVSIMLENILPRALSQAVLTKCLNQKVELITFFAVRILCTAIQKLQACVNKLQEASKECGRLWKDATSRLKNEFSLRYPKMKDIVATWRSTPKENSLQREAILRLIRCCYRTTPQAALEERIDASAALVQSLNRYSQSLSLDDSVVNDGPARSLELAELNHLLQIARQTTDMRWFSKHGEGDLSPCGHILKILASTERDSVPREMYDLIISLIKDFGMLQFETSPSGIDALLASLKPLDNHMTGRHVFLFVDDILERTSKKPIKYEDDMSHIREATDGIGSAHISLAWATVVEQWPFVLKRDEEVVKAVACWIARFAAAARIAGEDHNIISHTIAQMAAQTPKFAQLLKLNETQLGTLRGLLPTCNSKKPFTPVENPTANSHGIFIEEATFTPLEEGESHKGLHIWSAQPDLATAIMTNSLPPLILCLSSEFEEVRTQALTSVRAITMRLQGMLATANAEPDPLSGTTVLQNRLKQNAFPDASPFYLLLGIVSTTCLPLITKSKPSRRVPGIVTSYGAAAAKVLLDPLHPVYDKVNSFHTRAPKWNVSHIASYWVNKILLEPPSDDVSISLTSTSSSSSNRVTGSQMAIEKDESTERLYLNQSKLDAAATPYSQASHNEMHFLLCVVINSLRDAADVENLRSKGTFEPLLSLVTASSWQILPLGLRQLVVILLWRVTLIEGGATTLITRYGIWAYIDDLISCIPAAGKERLASSLVSEEGLLALKKCIWDHCDQQKVKNWLGDNSTTVHEIIGAGEGADQKVNGFN